MEHEGEAVRLDLKTDRESVERQASWAGIGPGMRVADIGCGSGKTSRFLHELVQPGGTVLGLDGSPERIVHAREQHGRTGLVFACRDLTLPLAELGPFDFIWCRFFLEYHRSRSSRIVEHLVSALAPGGIICLIDLDYNCLTHYGLPDRLQRAIEGLTAQLETEADFDPYVGRKLYSSLYDLGLEELDVAVAPHHLIFGELGEIDAFNWRKKLEVGVARSGFAFAEYQGGYGEFCEEFQRFFADPRRFTYTPAVWCRGRKPGV